MPVHSRRAINSGVCVEVRLVRVEGGVVGRDETSLHTRSLRHRHPHVKDDEARRGQIRPEDAPSQSKEGIQTLLGCHFDDRPLPWLLQKYHTECRF